jgi:hypothetical protein
MTVRRRVTFCMGFLWWLSSGCRLRDCVVCLPRFVAASKSTQDEQEATNPKTGGHPNRKQVKASTGSDRRGRAPVSVGIRSAGLGESKRGPLPEVIYRSREAQSSTRRASGATDSGFKGGKLRNNNGPPDEAGGPQSFTQWCRLLRSRQLRAIVRKLLVRALGNLPSRPRIPNFPHPS